MKTKVREKPIMFDGESVRAILEGRKTQTRRVVHTCCDVAGHPSVGSWGVEFTNCDCGAVRNPYGCPGTRLWVRETWAKHRCAEDRIYPRGDGHTWGSPIYKATHGGMEPACEGFASWRSPIHMPKWAARLWLEVVNVRVERVQDMGGVDLVAEGGEIICEGSEAPGYRIGDGPMCDTPSEAFADRWDAINASKGYPFESNPWVWVIEFKRLETNP